MHVDGDPEQAPRSSLLAPQESAPFRVLNAAALQPLLLLCDHASRKIPIALGDLGLDPAALRSHLAWDIGAGALTRQLAKQLQVTAILAEYSRLVIDCNRNVADPEVFLKYGDGVPVPGNTSLSVADRDARVRSIYKPYHAAITAGIDRLCDSGNTPVTIAIHSFTPVLDGCSRPWEIGILWDKDPRVKDRLIPALRKAGITVGDNEPYSGRAPQDYTIDYHAEARGLPHAGIEVRQDLIDKEQGVDRLAALLGPLLATLPGHLDRKFEVGSGARRKSGGRHGRN